MTAGSGGATTGAAGDTDGAFRRTWSAGRDVLVVGSYPPVPTAGATVTVEVVRELWADGASPHVAAPRASAAQLTSAVTGPFAGRRLADLRSVTGAPDVVLCAERGLPVPTRGLPRPVLRLVQRITVDRVVRALAEFDHVTLIACGDHGIPDPLWARLVFAADRVADRSDAVGTLGVTTLGPPEPATAYLARQGRCVARRLLGRHAARIRRLLDEAARVTRGA